MDSSQISLHQLRVFEFVRDKGRWVTISEIQDGANVAARTARQHARKLVELQVFEQAAVFPGYRYRLSSLAEKRNPSHMLRLTEAREAFGAS